MTLHNVNEEPFIIDMVHWRHLLQIIGYVTVRILAGQKSKQICLSMYIQLGK